MAFSIQDFHDLVRLLEEHPEWRAELRRLTVSDELLDLPGIVRELAEAQRRTEQRVEELAEAQRRTEQRIEELAEAQRRTEQRIEELAEAQRRTEERLTQLIAQLETLTETIRGLAGDVSWLKGSVLELRYRAHIAAYFGKIARRLRILSTDELYDLLDQGIAQGTWTAEEADQLIAADIIVRGRRDDDPVYLVIEVSWGIGLSDIQRAYDRARILSRSGTPAMPVVAGNWLVPDAKEPLAAMNVQLVTDGAPEPRSTVG